MQFPGLLTTLRIFSWIESSFPESKKNRNLRGQLHSPELESITIKFLCFFFLFVGKTHEDKNIRGGLQCRGISRMLHLLVFR